MKITIINEHGSFDGSYNSESAVLPAYKNIDTTLLCSLYIPKGEELRVNKTIEWYNNITQTAGHPFKLWVVDDASEEKLDDIIKHLQPKGFCKEVLFIKSNNREGKAKKLNHLLRVVTTKYVGVLDNDILLPLTWLSGSVFNEKGF